MTTIKLTYQKEIRRLLFNNPISFNELIKQSYAFYPSLEGKEIQFAYYDDENDRVIISSEIEFQEALNTMISSNKGYPRFEILPGIGSNTSTSTTLPTSTTTNPSNEICCECHLPLVGGISYKCSARSGYEICERCEANNTNQLYPMIKFYSNLIKSNIVVTIKPTNNSTTTSTSPSSSSSYSSHHHYHSIPEEEKYIHKNIRCDGCGSRT